MKVKWATVLLVAGIVLFGAISVWGATSTSDAADWLQAQQNAAGWFPWTPGGVPTKNTQGPSGLGVLSAYLHTKNGAYLLSATSSGNYMLNPMWVNLSVYSDGDPRFATHDPLFIEALSKATGNPSYANFVKTYFWDKLKTGTYGENNNLDAAGYGTAVVDARQSQGIVELSPWDLSAAAIAAHYAGEYATQNALMGAILDGLERTTSAGGYDVIGLAGAVWASAITGINLDPKAGIYASANSTADLAAILAKETLASNDGAWLWSSTADPTDPSNGDVQTTAFAIAALNAFDRATYLGQIARGVAFIRSLQQADGQFLCWPGAPLNSAGSVEVNAEAVSAIVYTAPSAVYVDDDFAGLGYGDDPAGPGVAVGYDAFGTIAGGIDAVGDSTVNVGEGTYEEQVVINKDLELIGSGSGTIIESPVSLSEFFHTSADNYPIVLVRNDATATIKDLVVDGLGRGNGNYRFIGIGFYNAGGTVDNVEVRNVMDTPFSGAQHGIAIYAFNDDGQSRTLEVMNSSIHDFQKNAMALNGAGLSVNVHGNTITGIGPTGSIAQNGIQVGWNATGTVSGNTVSGVWYTGPNWGSSGILLYAPASGMSVTGNDVVGCQLGIPGYWADGLQILRNNIRGSEWGIDLYETHGANIHYNAITGSTQAALWTNHPADATLNWWGSATGPAVDTNNDGVADYGGTGGLISATGDIVIFSPWLGIAPDGDPSTPGVQITGPMLIIVAPLGPKPTTKNGNTGYLDKGIQGSNELPYTDTIYVKHGTYDASEPITDGVTIVSEPGSAAHTTLNGNMSLNVRNIIIGRMRQGFSIHGNLAVGAGVDASTIHINWNDIYGTVANNGTGTLDATYNFWDGNAPWNKTIGAVDYYPYLPDPAGVIIGYIDDLHLSPDDAITYANLTDGGMSGADALTVLHLMHTYGFSQEEAQQLVREYGRVRIHLAMMGAHTLHEFSVNLLGYGTSAGGGGSILDHQIAGGGGSINGVTLSASYAQGEPIHIAFTLTDPITGKEVTNAIATLSVVRVTPGEKTTFIYWGMIPYDAKAGQYKFDYNTSGLKPGYYDLYIGTNDGQTQQFRVEVTAP